MRPILAIVAIAFGALFATPGAAQQAPRGVIVAMAQQFVLRHFKLPPQYHFNIAFDTAELHPQPEGNYWAVVGGFRAKDIDTRYYSHIFVAALRLTCPDHKDLKCWRLEKLAIDRAMLVDQGKPI